MPEPLASKPPILIAVFGNEFGGDDAVGPWVARELSRRVWPGVQVEQLPGDLSRLMDYLPGRQLVIVVDAVASDPGSAARVIDCAWSEAAAGLARGARTSTHGLCLADQLELAERLGLLPPAVWLVGITATDFTPGMPDPDKMNRLARAAADRIQHVIQRHRRSEPAHA